MLTIKQYGQVDITDVVGFWTSLDGVREYAPERAGLSGSLVVLGADATTRHPADWPLPHERAHQDALWFCSGGDQLL